MESKNGIDNKITGMTERTLVSDILRGLVNAGYGQNNKILKYEEIKDLLNDNYDEHLFDNIFFLDSIFEDENYEDDI